jgi:hypothetical protein
MSEHPSLTVQGDMFARFETDRTDLKTDGVDVERQPASRNLGFA